MECQGDFLATLFTSLCRKIVYQFTISTKKEEKPVNTIKKVSELKMITKTFICDLCKKSVGETELLKVSASVTVPKQVSYSGKKTYSTQKLLSCDKDICKDCMKAKGLIDLSKEGEEQEETGNQKTFETKFIDFLEDIGVAFVE